MIAGLLWLLDGCFQAWWGSRELSHADGRHKLFLRQSCCQEHSYERWIQITYGVGSCHGRWWVFVLLKSFYFYLLLFSGYTMSVLNNCVPIDKTSFANLLTRFQSPVSIVRSSNLLDPPTVRSLRVLSRESRAISRTSCVCQVSRQPDSADGADLRPAN